MEFFIFIRILFLSFSLAFVLLFISPDMAQHNSAYKYDMRDIFSKIYEIINFIWKNERERKNIKFYSKTVIQNRKKKIENILERNLNKYHKKVTIAKRMRCTILFQYKMINIFLGIVFIYYEKLKKSFSKEIPEPVVRGRIFKYVLRCWKLVVINCISRKRLMHFLNCLSVKISFQSEISLWLIRIKIFFDKTELIYLLGGFVYSFDYFK